MSLEQDVTRILEASENPFKGAKPDEVKRRQAEAERVADLEIKRQWDSLTEEQKIERMFEYLGESLSNAITDMAHNNFKFADDATWDKALEYTYQQTVLQQRWRHR